MRFLSQSVSAMGGLFRALAWALIASALLLGPPLVLVRYIGNPLPTAIPSGDDVSFAITNGQIDAWTWIKALALIGWLAWANLAISFVVELLGALRGGKTKAIRGLGATQWFAARVVAQCSLAASLLFQSTSAVTASVALLPLPMPAAVAFVETESVDVSLDQESVEADHRIEDRFNVDVGRRDTLWGLAERHLGDGHQWEIIRDANVGRTMADGTVLPQGFIRVERGWSLIVPGLPSVETARPPASPGGSDVTVERGDNLWRLSEKRLESADHDPGPAEVLDYVNDVVERNDQAIDDPDLIFPGQVFTFPGLDPDDDGLPIVVNDDDGLTDETDFGAGADVNVGIDPDVDDGLGDTGPLRHERADFEVVEVAHGVSEESLSASSARGEPLRIVGSMTVGAAGALLAAGALRMMRRRRRYRMAHRTPGTVPSSPLPELDPIERALHRQGDEETLRWLHQALSSLAARPVWEGEYVAQPVMAMLSGDYLDVEFAGADSMAAPLPWATPDDGLHWHLLRSTAVDDIPGGAAHSPIPILVTLGVDTLINLEGVGVLAVVGIGPEPMDLIRSLVHELATSIEAGIIDVRSTMPIAGTESYELVQIQSPSAMTAELLPWLDDVAGKLDEAQATNAFAHRLVQGDEPLGPVVLITDSSGLAEMDELVERARRRTLPLAIVATGRAATAVTDYSIEVTAHSATIQPWDETIEPQLLTEDVAAALGELLVDARATTEEPLVTGVQLSASVTDLRTRFDESSLGHHAGLAPAPAPAAGRNLDVVALETALDPVGDRPLPTEALVEGYVEAEPEATITIRVLGEVEAEGAPELTSQQLSMVTYLACNGASSKAALIDGLWDGQVISQSRFPNLLAEVRARIGRNHLPEVRDGRYVLSGVTTDLAEFERGVRAAQKRDDEQAMATLRSIMGLVRGVPLTPPANRFWSWVGDQTHFGARVEAMVADTAARLARLEQARDQLDRAIWACEQGLAASPTDETLTIVLTEVYLAQGKPGLARRLVDGWEDKISRMACGEPSDGPRKRLAG